MAGHTVVVAGGTRLFRSSFARVVDTEPDFDVVAVVDHPNGAEVMCDRLNPSVAVIDSGADHRGAALRACGGITAQAGRTKVLLTAETEDPTLLLEAIQGGIDGFATRAEPIHEIIDATRTVANGEARVPPRMLGVLLRGLIEHRREEETILVQLSTLTAREREVAALLAAGMNRDAIAQHLVISRETARTHIQRVLAKLDAHSQLEAASKIAGSQSALRFSRAGGVV